MGPLEFLFSAVEKFKVSPINLLPGAAPRALLIGGAWARPQVALVLGYVVALGSY